MSYLIEMRYENLYLVSCITILVTNMLTALRALINVIRGPGLVSVVKHFVWALRDWTVRQDWILAQSCRIMEFK